jgi:hypothetical protein
MKILVSPTGSAIIGTLERIPGIARIDNDGSIERSADGFTFDFEWAGGTDVDWDGQQTIYRKAPGELRDAPQRVFVDENGEEWLETSLRLADPSEDEEEAQHATA